MSSVNTVDIRGANTGAVAVGDMSRAAVSGGHSDAVIRSGDTVQLKSGGPIMTVRDIIDGGAACCWFAGKTLIEQPIPVFMLVPARPAWRRDANPPADGGADRRHWEGDWTK